MTIPIAGAVSNVSATVPNSISAADAGSSDFSQTLDGVLGQVNSLQSDATTKVGELLQGNGQDLHSAMIAVEKANLSFQLMMQVRNKIVQAYQTVSQMQF